MGTQSESVRKIPIFAAQNFELMANHASTRKSVRKTATRNDRNRYQGKTTRNAIRDFRKLEDKETAGAQYPELTSKIDKLVKRGLIHRNKAANLKSKLSKAVARMEK